MSAEPDPSLAHDPVLLSSSTFARTIAELSEKHQLRCSVRLLRKGRSPHAEACSGRRINVTPALLEESDEEQSWTAAHEFGHLVSIRTRGPAFYPWGYFAWLAVVVVLASPLPITAFVLLQPVLTSVGISRIGIFLAICATCWAAAALCGHLALLRLARHKLPLEREADQFARSEGYPVTTTIVAMLRRHEGPSRQHPRRAQYRHHPLPEERQHEAP